MLRAQGVAVVDLRGKLPLRAGSSANPYPERFGGLANVKWFVVHHTGAGTARPTILDTANYQTGPGTIDPFPGLAYTAYVEPDGTLEIAWDLEDETWSQGIGSPTSDANGFGINNEYGVAMCFSGQDPTDAQWATETKAHAVLETVVGHSLVFTGHRLVDPSTTDCPGNVAAGRLQNP